MEHSKTSEADGRSVIQPLPRYMNTMLEIVYCARYTWYKRRFGSCIYSRLRVVIMPTFFVCFINYNGRDWTRDISNARPVRLSLESWDDTVVSALVEYEKSPGFDYYYCH